MRVRPRIHCRPAARLLLCTVLVALPGVTSAQRVRVGPDTQLQEVGFAFTRGQSFSAEELRKQLAEPVLGKHTTLRRTFGWFPFVSPVEPAPFDPLELQRDVARMRDFYQRAGFRGTDVRYRVSIPGTDLVAIRFLITEGEPVRLVEVIVVGADSTPPESWLPAELQRPWKKFASDLATAESKRLGDEERRAAETAVIGWFREHGYPFVVVQQDTTLEPATRAARLRLAVTPGPRARIGIIEVVGTRRVDPGVVRKTLPFASGDWYSAKKVSEGQRALVNLNLFHVAVAEVPQQAPDSLVNLRVRLEESKPRLVTGEVGYLSDAGLTLKGEWAHRNYFGGARTLSVSAVAQTGVWAWEDNPERLLRGTVSLTQPGVISQHVALVTSPYLEYRDDYRDLSTRVGLDATLVYLREGWVKSATLKYGISSRRVFEYRGGSGGNLSIFELVQAALDSLAERNNRSAFTLAATLGRQDHPVHPRQLLLFRPSLEVTTPQGLNTAEYTRLDLSTSLQRPLHGRVSFWGRAAVGRLYPFGKSIPQAGGENALERFLELRDYTFTAGGTGDVRGWGSRMLGPKIPDVIVGEGADSTRVRADRYVPVSGLARITVSGELRLPFPGLSADWGTHAFVDGGRVRNPDERYVGKDSYDQERFFFSAGFGIDRDTPVGPARLSLGWMLNPSLLDVLKPQEFVDDVENGTLGSRRTPWTRRVQVHLAIGAGF
jgi:outer membrane protein insertion porin family